MTSNTAISDFVYHLSREILKMNPGQLARLRRMDVSGPGAMEYWKLIVSSEFKSSNQVMQLVKTMAILTPKGPPNKTKKLHSQENSLGHVLSMVNYPETRLMRLIALQHTRRFDALERIAKWISAKHTTGVNCVDIACLLFSKDVKHTRRLAEEYYRKEHHKYLTEVTQ